MMNQSAASNLKTRAIHHFGKGVRFDDKGGIFSASGMRSGYVTEFDGYAMVVDCTGDADALVWREWVGFPNK